MSSRMIVGLAVGSVAVLVLAAPRLAAQDAPCSQCGPGSHWVDTCSAGQDQVTDHGALVGIDLDLDCLADTSLVLMPCGASNLVISRSAPLDDSANFAGLRTADSHLDVIDTEIVQMCLTGGGVTLRAGAGQGQGATLAQSLGAIAEKTGNDATAESFFDVFFEVDLGNSTFAYNQTAMRIKIDITCVPPLAEYIHVTDCIELFDTPTPGQGTKVANLVEAEHHVFPGQPAACCTAEGDCTSTTQSECEALGGTIHPGLDCDNTGACCQADGTCTAMTEPCCEAANGIFMGNGSQCSGDNNGDGVDDLCEDISHDDTGQDGTDQDGTGQDGLQELLNRLCGSGACGATGAGMVPLMLLGWGVMKVRASRDRRRRRMD